MIFSTIQLKAPAILFMIKQQAQSGYVHKKVEIIWNLNS